MLLFVLALFITGGIIFLLLTSLKQMDGVNMLSKKSGNVSPELSVQDNAFVRYNEQLLEKLNNLRQLDEQFTDMLISPALNKNYDSLNNIILQEEEAFRKRIERMNQEGKTPDNKEGKSLLAGMIASFRSILESRKAVGSLRNAVAIGQNSFTPDEKALFKLQEELMTKTNLVATLGNSLSTLEKKAAAIPAALVNNQNAKFADSIKFVANTNVLENKITTLTANINNLKQDNERLRKLQNEYAGNMISNEAVLREKNILQQRMESLNADLQLARVDCNLSRVDATQIISTAKQRKLLLNEASSILTDLAASGNAEMKRKVQEKIVRLNQVAANSRD